METIIVFFFFLALFLILFLKKRNYYFDFDFSLNKKIHEKNPKKFSSVQREDSVFKRKRRRIRRKKFKNKKLIFYANKIEKEYIDRYGSFKHCPSEEIRYLKEKRQLYEKQKYTIKLESLISNKQIVKLFTKNNTKIEKYTNFLNDVLDPILYYLKHKFDRIRPEFCKEGLRLKESKDRVHLPNHASFPSAHAATAYFLYFMEPTERNLEIANHIAINREIATLHYPSDTHFGKFIAYSMFRIIN